MAGHGHDDQITLYGLCLTCAEAGDHDEATRAEAAHQLTFAEAQPDGDTYVPELDRARLGAQAQRVLDLMNDGTWRTLGEISTATGDPEASCSARLRDLRKPMVGGHQVDRRHRGNPEHGLYEYRLTITGAVAPHPVGSAVGPAPAPEPQQTPPKEQPVHITQLRVRNVRRIQAVEISPEGNLVVISGANGEGKTSVLDAIWLALGGGKATAAIADPLRHGTTSGEAEVTMGDVVVTRSFTADGKTKLHVRNLDGSPVKQQQTFLDSLASGLSFDPLAFAHASEKDQRAQLLPLLDLPFDPDELAAERQMIYDRRTPVNTEVRMLTDRLGGLTPPEAGLPENEVDTAEVRAEYRAAMEQRMENQQAIDAATRAAADLEAATAAVEDRRTRLVAAQAEHAEATTRAETASMALEFLEDPDVAAIEQRQDELEAVNVKVRAAATWHATSADLEDARARAAALTAELDAHDQRRDDAMAKVAMPIDGLGVTDDGVTFGGVPLAGASGAEQLRVSVAIAMALNPDLRVLRITDGSLLDSRSMALLAELAEANDFQVWIEVVDESGELGYTIEDGMVAHRPATA
jgi:hypothetical protein